MPYLILISIIWAFSFGLIKGELSGLDAYFVSFERIFISFVFFIPFVRKWQEWLMYMPLILTGAVQFGLMYILYIASYQYLAAWQIALFTVFTPLYVTLFADVWERRLNLRFLIATLIAVVGGGVVVYQPQNSYALALGFFLIQGANICFALGQVAYKRIRGHYSEQGDKALMPWLYLGALIITFGAVLIGTDFDRIQINGVQIVVLLYLGGVASGLGFFLWNLGVTQVNSGALAVMNNVKAPLAILVSVFLFNEDGQWGKALIGGAIIVSALFLTYLKPGNRQQRIYS